MIDEKRFPLEEIELKTREEILYNHRGDVGAFLSKKDGKDNNNLGYISCHSAIRSIKPESITDFIGVYWMEGDGAPELWEYITSLDGPFRDLFLFAPDGWSLLTKDNKVFGVRVPDKVFSFKPYPLMYSFLICSRIPHDFPEQASSFKYLLNKGIDKHKAFLMSIHFSVNNDALQCSQYTYWDGSHKCFRENGNKVIDFKSWCEGKYNKDVSDRAPSSDLWTVKSKHSLSKFCWNAYGTITKSKFGASVSTISDDGLKRMVEDLDKFIEMRYQ